jgi:hypothetical protein
LHPYRSLVLAAVAMGPIDGAGALHLALLADGHLRLQRDVPLADLSSGTAYPLDEPVPVGSRIVEAEVALAGPAPPVLVTKIILAEEPALPDAGTPAGGPASAGDPAPAGPTQVRAHPAVRPDRGDP